MALMGSGLPKECWDDINSLKIEARQDKWFMELASSYRERAVEECMEMDPETLRDKLIKHRKKQHKKWIDKIIKRNGGKRSDYLSYKEYIKKEREQTLEEVKVDFLNQSRESQAEEAAEDLYDDSINPDLFVDFIVCVYERD